MSSLQRTPTVSDAPELEAVERLLASALGLSGRARIRARHRALAAQRTGDRSAAPALLLAADLISSCWIELAADHAVTTELVSRLADAGVPRLALAREVLGHSGLLQLPPAVAVEVQLALLRALGELREVSLWTLDHAGALRRLGHQGSPRARRESEALAREVLDADVARGPVERGSLLGTGVERWGSTVAALVARVPDNGCARALALMTAGEGILAAVLEREMLLARGAGSERALVEAGERRLARLGIDLHDGPLQEIIVLAEDIRLLRHRLPDVERSEVGRRRFESRLEEMEAHLVTLEDDLRRLSSSLRSPFIGQRGLPAALDELCQGFTRRAGFEPRVTLAGDLEGLTDSQQMAILGVVREALSNVREHSGATEATISVSGDAGAVSVQVSDDGRGFDVERTLVRAARRGHLGLAGVHERVRLLGGSSRIESRPGGPTAISVTLPRWVPPAD